MESRLNCINTKSADLLRITALFLVILLHVAGTNFNNIYSAINIPVITISCGVISFVVIYSIRKMPLLRYVA